MQKIIWHIFFLCCRSSKKFYLITFRMRLLRVMIRQPEAFIHFSVSPLTPRCSNGYYGQPTVPGGSCQPCDCNGNLDLSTPGSCDPITGRCLRCRHGYGGEACNNCAEGYYGDAIVGRNCQRK